MPSRPIRIARPALISLLVAMATSLAHAQLHKCKDEKGRITYSDQGCMVVPEKAPAPGAKPVTGTAGTPATALVTAGKATGGKLTEASVTALIKYASDLAITSDYRAQCALAAPDLKFTITDHGTTPPQIVSGGRADICALQRSSVQVIETNQLKPAFKVGKQNITLNPEGNKATAIYETTTILSHQGQVVMQQRCSRHDVFGVYGDQILYAGVTATCKPF